MVRSASWMLLSGALVACQSPTQISVDVETNVPCGQVTATAFTAGELGALESLPATATSTTCDEDGHLGMIVLVPSDAKNAEVGFKLVTALNGRTTDACSGAAAANDTSCIVARRALRYIPNTPLKVIVDMAQVCEGRICDPQTTCVDGACVSATIPDPTQCEGPGCDSSVLAPPDAGVDAGVDATVDAGVDATVDAGTDTGAGDAALDGPTDSGESNDAAGGVCTPGAQQCAGTSVTMCGANGEWGAPWPCATGACAGGACTGATNGSASPSCSGGGPGLSNCGEDAGDDCCASLEVPQGSYSRSFNGASSTATVNGFRLDKYLVTVGRFRRFVDAWDGGAGFEPDAGSGKHVFLNGGLGLVDVGNDAGLAYEPGWVASDDSNVMPTNANLACAPSNADWTNAADAGQETLPMNCVEWPEAVAFCIWDGGFLPSEAEWMFAAAGGSELLQYPWGSTDPSTAPNQYAIYGQPLSDGGAGCFFPTGTLASCSGGNIAPVGSAPHGVAPWGQLDMGGDVKEWNLDIFEDYADACVDCAYLTGTKPYRAVRGGSFHDTDTYLQSAQRDDSTVNSRANFVGFRCARAP